MAPPSHRLTTLLRRPWARWGLPLGLLGVGACAWWMSATPAPETPESPIAAAHVDAPSVALTVDASFTPFPSTVPGIAPLATALPMDVLPVDALPTDAIPAPFDPADDALAFVPAPSVLTPMEARPVVAAFRPRPDIRRHADRPVLWAADVDVNPDLMRPVAANVAAGDVVAFALPVADDRLMETVPVRVRSVVTDVNRVTTLTGEVDNQVADLFFHATDGERAYTVYKSTSGGRSYTLAWNEAEGRHVYTAYDTATFPTALCAKGMVAGLAVRPPAADIGEGRPEAERRALAALPADRPEATVGVTPFEGEAASSLAQRNADYENLLAGWPNAAALQAAIAEAVSTGAGTVDILVAYNGDAEANMKAVAGTVENEVAVQIAQANWIYRRSCQASVTPPQLNLAASHKINLPAEHGNGQDFLALLNAMVATDDGVIDELNVLRDAYGADLMTMLINPTYTSGWVTTGLAYMPFTAGTYAVSAVWHTFCDSRGANFTLPHEIGHNFGANHAREIDSSVGTDTTAAGHFWPHPSKASGGYYKKHNYLVDQQGQAYVDTDNYGTTTTDACTVMTYDGQTATGNAFQLPYMSNPNLTVQFNTSGTNPYTNMAHAVAMGTAQRNNMAAMVSNTNMLAAYRTTAVYDPALPPGGGHGTSGDVSTTQPQRYYYIDVPANHRLVLYLDSVSVNAVEVFFNGPPTASSPVEKGYWPTAAAESDSGAYPQNAFAESSAYSQPARYYITVARTAANTSTTNSFSLMTWFTAEPPPAPVPSTPVFSVAGGTFPNGATLSITSANASTIRYTTDGSVPTATHGHTLANGGLLTLSSSCTLRAVGVSATSGVDVSAERTGIFTIGLGPETDDGWYVAGIGDFDDDDKDDILWRHRASGKTRIAFMDGTRVKSQAYTGKFVDNNWTLVGTGTFDSDSKYDILWRHNTTGKTYIWFMNGAALKAEGYTAKAVGLTWSVAGLGDFNGDGQTDILWRNTAGQTYLWLMNGKNLLGEGQTNYTVGLDWSIVGVGDFDGNGKSDVLWRNAANGQTLIWFMNGKTVTARTYTTSTVKAGWTVLGIGNFNGDGGDLCDDILWRNTAGQTFIWFMNGATVTAESAYTSKTVGADWTFAGVGAFNADDDDDIAWVNNTNGQLYIWLMDGKTVLAGSGYLSAQMNPGWRVVGTGDFDADGHADVLWRNAAGQTYIWFLQSGGTVKAASAYTAYPNGATRAVGAGWTVAGVGDFNADQHDDILWRNTANGQTFIWFMQGKTVLATSDYTSSAVGHTWTVKGVGDFNGDGYADVLWRNADHRTYLWFMDGKTVKSISGYTTKTVGAAWTVEGVGDFDGDGRADILWRSSTDYRTYLWFMNEKTVKAESNYTHSKVDATWQVAGVTDYSNDGTADILWRNAAGGTYIWIMDGLANSGGYTTNSVGVDWLVQGVGPRGLHGLILWRHAQTHETYVWTQVAMTSSSVRTTKQVQ